MTVAPATASARPRWARAILAIFAPGRFGRGVVAWLAAAASAALLGASLTVGYILFREVVLQAPFPVSDWWVFLHLWRPLLIVGAILVPMLSGPLTALAVFVIRRANWRRPHADIVAGAVVALVALGAIILIARNLGPMGDGP